MTKTMNPTVPAHFYSLDAIRGIACIIVVFYHWQLFFYKDDVFVLNAYNKAALPLYDQLAVFYNNGMVAVDLFFLLSGFIFFWLYAGRIAGNKMTFGKFFLFRMSRLYPIHLLALLLVTILQWIMLNNLGHYFIIQLNDPYHFILNVLLIQNWGFESGASFNGPSWSVSIEVFLYLMFYLICRLRWQSNKLLLLLLIPLGAIIQHYDLLIGKGIFSFFLGALIYYLYEWLLKENRLNRWLTPILILTFGLWILIMAEYKFGFLHAQWVHWIKVLQPGITNAASESAYGVVRNLFFRVTVSPCTILSLVLWETGRRSFSKNWAWVGNSSYALYLLHFPLQIIFVLVLEILGVDRSILSHPLIFCFFFALLIPISVTAYYYFELPLQEKMRAAFSRKRKPLLATYDTPAQ